MRRTLLTEWLISNIFFPFFPYCKCARVYVLTFYTGSGASDPKSTKIFVIGIYCRATDLYGGANSSMGKNHSFVLYMCDCTLMHTNVQTTNRRAYAARKVSRAICNWVYDTRKGLYFGCFLCVVRRIIGLFCGGHWCGGGYTMETFGVFFCRERNMEPCACFKINEVTI